MFVDSIVNRLSLFIRWCKLLAGPWIVFKLNMVGAIKLSYAICRID